MSLSLFLANYLVCYKNIEKLLGKNIVKILKRSLAKMCQTPFSVALVIQLLFKQGLRKAVVKWKNKIGPMK